MAAIIHATNYSSLYYWGAGATVERQILIDVPSSGPGDTVLCVGTQWGLFTGSSSGGPTSATATWDKNGANELMSGNWSYQTLFWPGELGGYYHNCSGGWYLVNPTPGLLRIYLRYTCSPSSNEQNWEYGSLIARSLTNCGGVYTVQLMAASGTYSRLYVPFNSDPGHVIVAGAMPWSVESYVPSWKNSSVVFSGAYADTIGAERAGAFNYNGGSIPTSVTLSAWDNSDYGFSGYYTYIGALPDPYIHVPLSFFG